MKKLIYTLALPCLVITFIVVGISLAKKPKTKYQECVELSKHLRSDRDIEKWQRAICDGIEYEKGDYK